MHSVIDKAKLAEQLLEAVKNDNQQSIRNLLTPLVAEDIAEILEATPVKERHILWSVLTREQQGEILVHTNDEVRASLLEQHHGHQIVKMTEALGTDDITDIIQALDKASQKSFLAALDVKERSVIETALSYPDDTAGGLMSSDFIAVRADITLDVVLRYLRKLGELPHATTEILVRDRDDHYVGTLRLTTLLLNDGDTLVSELIETETPAIRAYMPEKEVAHLFEKNDLISAAVVNDDNIILGRITIDDVVDIIREEAQHAQMIRAGLDEDSDIFAPPIRAARRRTFWLGINLLTAIFASMVIGLFQTSIEKIVALAILMPIIASMGGIAGTQTATIVIRALATGKLGRSNSRALLIKETLVGLLNGIIWAVLTGLAVQWSFNNWGLSAIFASAMLANLLAAAFAGAMIPLLLHRLKIDPALASGLMLTTVTDSLGFLVFLGLATALLI